ncbi:MAG: hypothetical protein MZW92_52335 [Comamonadaceae bacterium]|nr:hypothetical protein [Comamonadaceae bacterium]
MLSHPRLSLGLGRRIARRDADQAAAIADNLRGLLAEQLGRQLQRLRLAAADPGDGARWRRPRGHAAGPWLAWKPCWP